MTEYITQEQAVAIFKNAGVLRIPTRSLNDPDGHGFMLAIAKEVIQAYRDSLVAGVVLPEPVANVSASQNGCIGFVKPDEAYYTADKLRQAVADALLKSDIEISELTSELAKCRDAFAVPERGTEADGFFCSAIASPLDVSGYVKHMAKQVPQWMPTQPELKFTNARRTALRDVANAKSISIGHARTLEQHGLVRWLPERNRFLLSSSGASLLEKWNLLAAASDPKEHKHG